MVGHSLTCPLLTFVFKFELGTSRAPRGPVPVQATVKSWSKMPLRLQNAILVCSNYIPSIYGTAYSPSIPPISVKIHFIFNTVLISCLLLALTLSLTILLNCIERGLIYFLLPSNTIQFCVHNMIHYNFWLLLAAFPVMSPCCTSSALHVFKTATR